MKTIFLAEGEKHVREALLLMLEHQPDFLVAGEASTVESTLAKACQILPDVILLDWNLPGLHPQRMLAALHQCCPEALIVATSVRPEQENAANQLGANGFLLKQLTPDQFMIALISAVNQQELRK